MTSLIKGELDWRSDMKDARKEGLQEGLTIGHDEGLAEGRIEGIAEGFTKGHDEGRNEEKLNIARNLKTMGDSIKKIQAVTGLSIETISQL